MEKNSDLKFISQLSLVEVVFIDCLSIGDSPTSKRFREHLLDLRVDAPGADIVSGRMLNITYEHVDSGEKLRSILLDLELRAEDGLGRIVQIDCHGSESYFEVGDKKERFLWAEFLAILRKVNVAAGCNIGLVLACCYGPKGYKIKDFAEAAPFYFQLSSHDAILVGNLESQLTAFYSSLICDGNVQAAANLAPEFSLVFAEQILAETLFLVVKQACTRKARQEWLEWTLTEFVNRGGLAFFTLGDARKLFRSSYGGAESHARSIIDQGRLFLCGRDAAYSDDDLVAWALDGKPKNKDDR